MKRKIFLLLAIVLLIGGCQDVNEEKIDDILKELGSVAEGVKTSKAICELAKKLEIDVPVSSAIYEAVYTDITPQEVLSKLMNRKLKKEENYDKICR